MISRSLYSVAILSVLFFTQNVFSEKRAVAEGPQFSENTIQFTVKAGESFNIDLRTKLKNPNVAISSWDISSDKPSWMQLNKTSGFLSGNPSTSDLGTKTFKLSVFSGEGADFNHPTEIKVVMAPSWTQSPLNLGTQKQDQSFLLDLNQFISNPSGGSMQYAVTGLPSWMSLNSNGTLSGTPKRVDVGRYNGITFTATSTSTGLTAVTQAFGEVLITLYPPSWKINPLILPDGFEDSPYSNDISTNVVNPENGPLNFTLVNPPTWVQISSSGVVSGVPGKTEIGSQLLTVHLSSTVNGTILDGGNAMLSFNIIHVNHDPSLQQPISFTILGETPAALDLKPFATDFDGDKLTFEKLKGPSWATLSLDGILSGIPQIKDEGDNTFTVLVMDGQGGSATGKVVVKVTHKNHPPELKQPISFTVLGETEANLKLSSFASDDENDPLLFEKVSGPAWAQISSGGVISGTPQIADEGDNVFSIQVADGNGGFASGNVTVTVTHKNKPPVIPSQTLTFTVNEREEQVQDLTKLVTDPENDPLKFTLNDTLLWVSLTSNGQLTMKPLFKNIGEYSLDFTVSDGKLQSKGKINIVVLRDARPPVWSENPIQFDGKILKPFSESLSNKAKDLDGLGLTFSIVSGPAWLTLTENGALKGTPPVEALGENVFVVSVKNDLKSANATLVITLTDPNKPPVINTQALAFTVKERETQTQDLNKFVKDPEGDNLIFKLIDNPSWVSLSDTGTLVLQPEFKNIGEYALRFEVKDVRAIVQGTLRIKVLRDARPPVWSENPINLSGLLNKKFSDILVGRAKDLDGLPLKFSKVSGPEWLIVSNTGTLSGTPGAGTVGANTFKVKVENDLLSASADLVITVTDPNQAPIWKQDPILLGDITAETLYQFDLARFAEDPDGDTLTFKKIAGPSWLSVSTAGQLFGTPAKSDIGEFTAVFETSDGKISVQVAVAGKVIPKIDPNPVIVSQSLAFTVKEREVLTENLNQPKYVNDPQNRPLTFTLKESVAWAKLDASGKLQLSPLYSNIGTYVFNIKISNDVGGVAEGPLFIKVVRDPRPPVWLQNPIAFNTLVNKAFSATVSDKAKDNDNISLIFSKLSGPEWLSVNEQGVLTGTPLVANLGVNVFILRVSNDLLSADVHLNITVSKEAPVIETIDIAEPVAGAKVENLWVIDGTAFQSNMHQGLSATIADYFRDLKNAQVVSAGLYISTNPKEKLFPVPSRSGELLLDQNNVNIKNDWDYRTNSISPYSLFIQDQSLIYSLFLFQQKVHTLPVYHKSYMMSEVPMEVAFATISMDKYCYFAKKTPQAKYKPSDYAREFMNFHKSENKPYRISGMLEDSCGTTCCSSLTTEEPESTIVKSTQGIFKPVSNIGQVKDFISDYTRSVIFRAYVSAKNHIKLSKIPTSAATISVILAGSPLSGNTGSATDKWYYVSDKNEIVVRWSLIDMNALKAGDKLFIQYQSVD